MHSLGQYILLNHPIHLYWNHSFVTNPKNKLQDNGELLPLNTFILCMSTKFISSEIDPPSSYSPVGLCKSLNSLKC